MDTRAVDDAELIERIASDRDKAAFEELFERHRNDAFNIACHITGSPTLAEDVVQDAMLRVWLSAQSFRGEGNARGWILKVVAREGLKKLRRRRKESEREAQEPERRRTLPVRGESERSEREELLTGLRELVGELPHPQRQLVALYYGAGLTQQQISDAMHLPARTVSYRLEEALDWLREKLKGAGLAAALPLVDAQGLGQALCSGHAVPDSLAARVLDALDTAASMARASGSLRAAGFWSGRAAIAAAVLLLGAGGGAWLYVRGEAPDASDSSPASSVARTPVQETGSEATHTPQAYTWDFDNGLPDDLRIEGVNWKLEPGKGKPGGALYLGFDEAAAKIYLDGAPCYFYPKRKLVPPLHVSFDVFIPPYSDIAPSNVFWLGKDDAKIENVNEIFDPAEDAGPYKTRASLLKGNTWLRFNVYVTKDYVWGFHENTPRMFAQMKHPMRSENDSFGMTVGIKKGFCRIDNLRIEEIDASQLPPKLDSNGNPIPQE